MTDLSRFGYDDTTGLVVDNTHAYGEPIDFFADVSEDDLAEEAAAAEAAAKTKA